MSEPLELAPDDQTAVDTCVAIRFGDVDLLRRLERWTEAATAYERAAGLASNATERRFLDGRLAEARARIASTDRRPD